MRRRLLAGLTFAWIAAVALPGIASAHPLGNFTINHHAGIRVEPDRVLLDVVIDQAEIPAFQARLQYDTDGDGELSDDEIAAGRLAGCGSLQPALALEVAGTRAALTLTSAGLSFPPGAGGLSTLRLVCEFEAPLAAPITAATAITFRDTSFPERIGWREIVNQGSGTTLAVTAGADRSTSPSARLTSYPKDLIAAPLDDRSIAITASPGGAELAPVTFADATPVASPTTPVVPVTSAAPAAPVASSAPAGAGAAAPASATLGSVPGGVTGGELPSIFGSADLTPIVLLVSLLTAIGLGAAHALTPGHGKTLMAAYLVGSRGTALHAVGLGLSVTLSHTVGILALAAIIIGAQGVLAPDVVVRTAPVVAAISIVLIGGWMLVGEMRRRRGIAAAAAKDRALGHDHPHAHAHPARDHAHPADRPAQAHVPEHEPGYHEHGGVGHTHLPPAGSTITWRSLFVLGLAGGLIPSTSALLILLGSIAAGRPAFGLVLVVAFGLGMALVMGGVGVALVFARGRLERFDGASVLGRTSTLVPLAASVVVLSLGLYLTAQAVGGAPVL
jgi:nickel/cobalt transporter (NicO) family protein